MGRCGAELSAEDSTFEVLLLEDDEVRIPFLFAALKYGQKCSARGCAVQ